MIRAETIESDLEKTVDKAIRKHVDFHRQLRKCVQQGLLHYLALAHLLHYHLALTC